MSRHSGYLIVAVDSEAGLVKVQYLIGVMSIAYIVYVILFGSVESLLIRYRAKICECPNECTED